MQRKHILYLGLTLLISIIVNIIIEYYPTISHTFTFVVVSFIFTLLFFLSLNFLLVKYMNNNISLLKTKSVLDKITLLLVITGVEILIVMTLFVMSLFYSVIFTILAIGIIYLIFEDYDFEEFFTAVCVILCLCLLFGNLFPKEIENHYTTRGATYISKYKVKSLLWGKYAIYNTATSSKEKTVRELPFYVNETFAEYILKNIKKDIKVATTIYDKDSHTYKVMYEDDSIQQFRLTDIKMDKKLSTPKVVEYIDNIEREQKEKRLINS